MSCSRGTRRLVCRTALVDGIYTRCDSLRTQQITGRRWACTVTYSDAKVANRNVWDFGWEIAHEAVSLRPPIPLSGIVARTHVTRTPRNIGICPSFKDQFLSAPCPP